mmetsp:Transcript_15069/g.45174  ORF Transcript_15069/g.45174 Transcript_15069/m.45174 type:complete len:571 (-) Transcript_15069:856-2568(-)
MRRAPGRRRRRRPGERQAARGPRLHRVPRAPGAALRVRPGVDARGAGLRARQPLRPRRHGAAHGAPGGGLCAAAAARRRAAPRRPPGAPEGRPAGRFAAAPPEGPVARGPHRARGRPRSAAFAPDRGGRAVRREPGERPQGSGLPARGLWPPLLRRAVPAADLLRRDGGHAGGPPPRRRGGRPRADRGEDPLLRRHGHLPGARFAVRGLPAHEPAVLARGCGPASRGGPGRLDRAARGGVPREALRASPARRGAAGGGLPGGLRRRPVQDPQVAAGYRAGRRRHPDRARGPREQPRADGPAADPPGPRGGAAAPDLHGEHARPPLVLPAAQRLREAGLRRAHGRLHRLADGGHPPRAGPPPRRLRRAHRRRVRRGREAQPGREHPAGARGLHGPAPHAGSGALRLLRCGAGVRLGPLQRRGLVQRRHARREAGGEAPRRGPRVAELRPGVLPRRRPGRRGAFRRRPGGLRPGRLRRGVPAWKPRPVSGRGRGVRRGRASGGARGLRRGRGRGPGGRGGGPGGRGGRGRGVPVVEATGHGQPRPAPQGGHGQQQRRKGAEAARWRLHGGGL